MKFLKELAELPPSPRTKLASINENDSFGSGLKAGKCPARSALMQIWRTPALEML